MSESARDQAWQLLGNRGVWRAGFAFGVCYPSLAVSFRGDTLSEDEIEALAHGLIAALASQAFLEDWSRQSEALKACGDASGIVPVAQLLLLAMSHLQREAGLPVFEAGCVLSHDGDQAEILIPTTAGSYGLILQIMLWLLNACDLMRSGHRLEGHVEGLQTLLGQLQSQFGAHSTSFQFIAAAVRAGVPFVELPDQVVQYGQGHKTYRMLNSTTDATSNIGVHLSRCKHFGARILAESGLPIAVQHLVQSEEEAQQAAGEIGFPVVVKPADLDGGVAVSCDLRTPAEVSIAYGSVRARSERVLVEKHMPGRDYRITVLQGEVIWAVERVPGSIVGDGRTSVRGLIEQLNNDPRRKAASHAPLRPIPFDDEARTLLERAGLTEEDIPAAGQFIPLRRAANIASGGMPLPVLEIMHPDNARLAIRAAAAMRLDLAGIDLLIPDIAHSWLETGAAICEVNAGPDIGQTTSAHLYAPILAKLVNGSGRIPIILIAGAEPGSPLDRLVGEGLPPSDLMIGYHHRLGTRVGKEPLTREPVSCFLGGRMLVRDNRVEALVMQINDDSLLTSGLPFPRYDLLLIAGHNFSASDGNRSRTGSQIATELLAALLPACDGKVMQSADADFPPDETILAAGERWQGIMPVSGMEQKILSEIRGFIDKHQRAGTGPVPGSGWLADRRRSA